VLLTQPPGWRFDLHADKLDLDRYLSPHAVPGTGARSAPVAAPGTVPDVAPAPSPQPGPQPPSPQAQAVPAETGPVAARPSAGLFPVDLIRGLDLDGRLVLDELHLAGLSLGGLSLHAVAAGGQVRIDERVERFYQGKLEGSLALDAREDPPRPALDQKATGIQAGPLLQDLTGEQRLTGRGDLEAKLHARGQDQAALKRSLGGEARIRFSDGVVEGIDLERTIRDARARLEGRPVSAQGPRNTPYTDLSASAAITDGVLDNRDLRALSAYLHISGRGRVDIAHERLDYRFEPVFVNPPEGRGIKEIEGIPVPVHLTGSFTQPKWDIELGPVLREVAKRKLGEELDKPGGGRLRELEERTGIKGLEQGLRGLLGR